MAERPQSLGLRQALVAPEPLRRRKPGWEIDALAEGWSLEDVGMKQSRPLPDAIDLMAAGASPTLVGITKAPPEPIPVKDYINQALALLPEPAARTTPAFDYEEYAASLPRAAGGLERPAPIADVEAENALRFQRRLLEAIRDSNEPEEVKWTRLKNSAIPGISNAAQDYLNTGPQPALAEIQQRTNEYLGMVGLGPMFRPDRPTTEELGLMEVVAPVAAMTNSLYAQIAEGGRRLTGQPPGPWADIATFPQEAAEFLAAHPPTTPGETLERGLLGGMGTGLSLLAPSPGRALSKVTGPLGGRAAAALGGGRLSQYGGQVVGGLGGWVAPSEAAAAFAGQITPSEAAENVALAAPRLVKGVAGSPFGILPGLEEDASAEERLKAIEQFKQIGMLLTALVEGRTRRATTPSEQAAKPSIGEAPVRPAEQAIPASAPPTEARAPTDVIGLLEGNIAKIQEVLTADKASGRKNLDSRTRRDLQTALNDSQVSLADLQAKAAPAPERSATEAVIQTEDAKPERTALAVPAATKKPILRYREYVESRGVKWEQVSGPGSDPALSEKLRLEWEAYKAKPTEPSAEPQGVLPFAAEISTGISAEPAVEPQLKEPSRAIQEPSPETEVSRYGGAGRDIARDRERMGQGEQREEAAGAGEKAEEVRPAAPPVAAAPSKRPAVPGTFRAFVESRGLLWPVNKTSPEGASLFAEYQKSQETPLSRRFDEFKKRAGREPNNQEAFRLTAGSSVDDLLGVSQTAPTEVAAEVPRPMPPEAPAAEAPRPTAPGAPPTPEWLRFEIDRQYREAERRGVVEEIEALSAQRLTALEVWKRLGSRLPQDQLEAKGIIQAVRSRLGIPSMDDTKAFEAWLTNRAIARSRLAPPAAEVPRPAEPAPKTQAAAAETILKTPPVDSGGSRAMRAAKKIAPPLLVAGAVTAAAELADDEQEGESYRTGFPAIFGVLALGARGGKPIHTILGRIPGVGIGIEALTDKVARQAGKSGRAVAEKARGVNDLTARISGPAQQHLLETSRKGGTHIDQSRAPEARELRKARDSLGELQWSAPTGEGGAVSRFITSKEKPADLQRPLTGVEQWWFDRHEEMNKYFWQAGNRLGIKMIDPKTGKEVPRTEEGRPVVERILTPEALSILNTQRGPWYQLWEKFTREANNLKPEEAAEEMRSLREAARERNVGFIEFKRTLEVVPTAIRNDAGKVLRLYETDPLYLMERAVSIAPGHIAFKSRFGQRRARSERPFDPDDPRDVMALRLRAQFARSGGDVRDFDALIGALNQRPVWGRWYPRGANIGALSDHLKRLALGFGKPVLSGSLLMTAFLQNMVEPGGSATAKVGPKYMAKGLWRLLTDYKATVELLNTTGVISQVRADLKLLPGHKIERFGHAGRVVLDAVRNAVDEFGEKWLGAAALEWMNAVKRGDFVWTELQRERLRTLKFDEGQIESLVAGTAPPEAYQNAARRTVAEVIGTTARPSEVSFVANSPTLRTIFAFQRYAQMTMRNLDRHLVSTVEGLRSGEPGRILASSTQLLRLLLHGQAVGWANQYLLALMFGRSTDRSDESWPEWLGANVFAWVGGPPLAALRVITGATPDLSLEELGISAIPFGRAATTFWDMLTGNGQFRDLGPGESAWQLAKNLAPITKTSGALLSALGLQDPEMEKARQLVLRFERQKYGRVERRGGESKAEDVYFRQHTREAARLLRSGRRDEALAEVAEAQRLGERDADATRTSLQQRRLLSGFDDATREELRQKIGDRWFALVEKHDDLIMLGYLPSHEAAEMEKLGARLRRKEAAKVELSEDETVAKMIYNRAKARLRILENQHDLSLDSRERSALAEEIKTLYRDMLGEMRERMRVSPSRPESVPARKAG